MGTALQHFSGRKMLLKFMFRSVTAEIFYELLDVFYAWSLSLSSLPVKVSEIPTMVSVISGIQIGY